MLRLMFEEGNSRVGRKIISGVIRSGGAKVFTVGLGVLLAVMLGMATMALPGKTLSGSAISTQTSEAQSIPYVSPGGSAGCDFSINSCWWYVTAKQTVSGSNTIGAKARMSQHAPWTDPMNDHSLAEMVVGNYLGSTSSGWALFDSIEVGWVVWPEVYGDKKPHLFVKPTRGDQRDTADCWWPDWRAKKNRQTPEAARKSCGWVQKSNQWYPNRSTVAVDGRTHLYQIAYDPADGNWWVWYNNEWIGYIKGDWWPNHRFTRIGGQNTNGKVQWYGEVQDTKAPQNTKEEIPCTDMGNNGKFGTEKGAAVMSHMGLLKIRNGSVFSHPAKPIGEETDARYYSGKFKGNRFSYGGPGGC